MNSKLHDVKQNSHALILCTVMCRLTMGYVLRNALLHDFVIVQMS
jgi:hypothetical protein